MNNVALLHDEAMAVADLAFQAKLKGEKTTALLHFTRAYRLEREAAVMIADDVEFEPSRSVLLRSAATLALDCNLPTEAKELILIALEGKPPSEIKSELLDLLTQAYEGEAMPIRDHNEPSYSASGAEIRKEQSTPILSTRFYASKEASAMEQSRH